MTRQNRSEPDDDTHLLSTGRKSKDDAEPDSEDVDADNPYIRFGKQVHRKYLGFGTMGSAFFARSLITDTLVQAANEDRSARSLSHLKKAVTKHKEENSIQYRLMANAALKTMSMFPEIKDDFARMDNGVGEAFKDITSKLKQITKGMKAARQADTCTLKGAILGLAKDHAKRMGQTLDIGLKKDQRGIKNEGTACLLLPQNYVDDYLSDPQEFRAQVDRGDIVIGADEWPTFLYNEERYDYNREWIGLFLGETFVRACICILVSPSAAQEWPYGTPSSRTYAASNKKGNADLNNITEITPEVVAGLVCQVTFALSDVGSWKDKIGDIDLIELYTNTVRMLQMDFKWVDETLDTLQVWILGEKTDEESEDRVQMANERFEKLEKMMHAAESRGKPHKDGAQPKPSLQGIDDDWDDDNQDDTEDDLPIPKHESTRRLTLPGSNEQAPKSRDTQGKTSTRRSAQPEMDEAPTPKKRINRRPSTPPTEEEPSPNSDEERSWSETPPPPPIPVFAKGPKVAKPASSGRTHLRTSPPTIPASALHKTQDSLPSAHAPQRPKPTTLISNNAPSILRKSQGPTSTPRASQDLPSTPNPKSTPRTSCGPGPTPRKTQGSTSSTTSRTLGIQGMTQGVGAGGSQMPPPKVPAKRQPPTQEPEDNPPFGDSPLTENSIPTAPARKRRQKTKAVASTPTRRSQRAMSQMATDN